MGYGGPITQVLIRAVKIENIATFLGNATQENQHLQYCQNKGFNEIQFYGLYGIFGNPVLEAQLATFIAKARNNYKMNRITAIMGVGTAGFQLALNYNAGVGPVSQFNIFNKENEFWNGLIVDFVITPQNNFPYSITINGTAYPYTSTGGGQTGTQIATQLAAVIGIPAGILTVTVGTNKLTIHADRAVNVSYTYSNSANITATQIQETFANWIASMNWLRPQLAAWQEMTAYISNYLTNPPWGATEAVQMLNARINILETANFTSSPDELAVRQRQLYLLANAAYSTLKTQKVNNLFSAEDPVPNYMGDYIGLNGLNNTQNTWLGQYAADVFANKSRLIISGFSYFSYNNLVIHLP